MSRPGLVGWAAVGAVVLTADLYAKARHLPTMSAEYGRYFGIGTPIAVAIVAHLITYPRPA